VTGSPDPLGPLDHRAGEDCRACPEFPAPRATEVSLDWMELKER